ncbi:hypothetical protein QBC38DRAFT_489579 [Podospora fimiseda]|uniref:Transcription factor n=1 Tax=Podospora fimiseda TaxID=252190 RepID=A0AAN6YNJ7_9PEZI|nr:hypothetical protein QBC38DRAFT_489579 [Podospora fimiseda]
MANMARHGSAGNAILNGFSVFQPALGATLQWLPQIGTQELDDMINAFLPGPSSIQDKRAHISMDFFEYSRLTGENCKFYPVTVPATITTPVASPYDSGYGSNFKTSPVISDLSSWTQSPVAFAPVEEPVAAPRTPVKKPSASSTVDFASHPGMRIMTKDGRDVTNSASRGCKTKEQRDHAHLMRIIKACDACKRKKVRCDPSHRKRTGSQASTSPTEAKVTKKAKKTQKPAPVPAVPPPTDSLAADALMAPEMNLSFSAFDNTFNSDELDALLNQYIDFDQQPLAVANNDFIFNNFNFDSFTSTESFSTPSSAYSNSPSHVFTPTSAVMSDFSTEVTAQDATFPYMNSEVAHGTNYVDFNLYSPASSYYDEDPVFFQHDVGSRHTSVGVTNAGGLPRELPQHVPGGSPRPSPSPTQLQATGQRSESPGGYLQASATYRPFDSASAQQTSTSSWSAGAENVGSAVASVDQSSVSPSTTTRTGVTTPGVPGNGNTSRGVNCTGEPRLSGIPSSAIISQSSQSQSRISVVGVTGADGCQSRRDIAVNNTAQPSVGLGDVSPAIGMICSVFEQHLLQCSVLEKGLNAMLATIRAWTLPTRRLLAEKDGEESQPLQLSPFRDLSRLVVFGLVSILCASSQTHLASQQININPFNVVMAMTLISLASMALLQWCIGSLGVTFVSSKGLQIPKHVVQPAGDVQSLVGRRRINILRSLDSASVSFRLR